MNSDEVGAIPLLGLDGLVLVGHGRSDANALVNAVRAARNAVETDLLGAVREGILQQAEQARS
jgi:glycerol-3-phosphate acyltransferase PlsX